MEDDIPQNSSLRDKIYAYRTKALEKYRTKPISYWILLALSSAGMLVGFPTSSLLSRIYFSNGGKSKWLISWTVVAGWPISLLILIPTYFILGVFPTPFNLKLTLSYIFLGFLASADNLMFAYAYAYLPASTAALLSSSTLFFSAFFGYFLAKNKIDSSTINSVVLITSAIVIIALDSDSDKYSYVTDQQYITGFILDIMGSALHGLIFALLELVFVKFLGRRSFHVVLEQQVMVSLFGFLFTTIGVIVNKDFQAMKSEARSFKGGESSYYSVIIWIIVMFQLGILGSIGILFVGSTVLAGIIDAMRVQVTSIAAVVLLHDPMSGFKIVSLVITFWGFASYIYGNRS